MDHNTFTGWGATLEQAIDAAAKGAVEAWKPRGPDDQVELCIDSLGILYGGIVGHTGTRVARVSLPGQAAGEAVAAVSAGPRISMRLTAYPDELCANLMPPVPHDRPPQPRRVGLVLVVANEGDADYDGQSPDTAVTRFSVLKGRTKIWEFPEFAGQMVTPVRLRPGECRVYQAEWDIPDVVPLVGAELNAVARFVPSGSTAMTPIIVKAAV